MFAILIITIAATLFAGCRITFLQESNRINETASTIMRDVAVAVSASRADMKTFTALNRGKLEAYDKLFETNQVQVIFADNPAIKSIGSFKNEGNFSLPILDVVSSSGKLESLKGVDLGQLDGIQERLTKAIESNGRAVIITPDFWPDNSDVVLLQPSYRFSPKSIRNNRLNRFEGGYWAGFSFDAILTGYYSALKTAKANAVVNVSYTADTDPAQNQHDPIVQRGVYERAFSSQRSTWFPSLFASVERERQFIFGQGTIDVRVTGQPSLTFIRVLFAALVTGFIVTLFFMTLTVAYNRRRSNEQRMHALQAVTLERAKAERTLNTISESVVAIDDSLNVTYMNEAAIIALGVDAESVVGTPIVRATRFYEKENTGAKFDLEAALSALRNGESAELDVLIYDKNHVVQSMQLSMINSSENELHSSRYTLVLRNVSAERALTQELEYQANHDSLTGIWNRYYFENRLNAMVDSAQRKGVTHALVYMDLDQFKIVNDTCGHTAGDRLLKELTQNLTAVLRPGDVLARLGGDEFGLLVINASNEDAVQIAERIFAFFQNAVFYHEGKAFPIRASIGFVPINENSNDIGDVLSAADMACYTAKDSGRNCLNIYSEENAHIAQQQQDMNWLPRLQAALKDNHFQLLVQAVADTQTKKIEHYEFLLRLQQPDGTIVTPMQFIQAAERYDLMKDIDRWVIQAAMREIAEHNEALGGNASYSINLSGQSAADSTLLPFIQQCMTHSNVPAECIWFEITETAAITHFQVAVELFQKLRSMGSKVALDDFGSGLSSFGYLKNLPVDVIKIDGQFVKNLEHDHIDREMVSAIHRVAQAMGIFSVAEFVESEKSLEQLAAIGVDLAQGYHIARPCSLQEAVRQYHERKSKNEDGSDISNAA